MRLQLSGPRCIMVRKNDKGKRPPPRGSPAEDHEKTDGSFIPAIPASRPAGARLPRPCGRGRSADGHLRLPSSDGNGGRQHRGRGLFRMRRRNQARHPDTRPRKAAGKRGRGKAGSADEPSGAGSHRGSDSGPDRRSHAASDGGASAVRRAVRRFPGRADGAADRSTGSGPSGYRRKRRSVLLPHGPAGASAGKGDPQAFLLLRRSGRILIRRRPRILLRRTGAARRLRVFRPFSVAPPADESRGRDPSSPGRQAGLAAPGGLLPADDDDEPRGLTPFREKQNKRNTGNAPIWGCIPFLL